jgi:recombination associated protein RdgC
MFFRNLTLFRFPATNLARLADLDRRLAEHTLRACGPLELSTSGWVSPFGRGETALSHAVGPYILLALGGERRILPNAAINKALAEKCEKLETLRGRPVGGREMRKLKDEVITELMPRALVQPSRLLGYIDTAAGWVVIDSASRRAGEQFVSKLRETVGSFPAAQIEAEESPRAVMTEWLIDGKFPAGWAAGDECELRDTADQGAIARCRRQELESEEVREHLKSGKQVTQLALVFRERMRFVLDESLTMRKFKLLDVTTESLEGADRDSANAELDARFALMTLEIAEVLAEVERVFGVQRPVGG